jgi:ABC-type lipoprotein release transport system permease subunit
MTAVDHRTQHGVLAATVPARRAARLDVLEAIASE